ncbi:MAG TPA: PEGA domain-containing protein [Vicinamibacterales bacterium]|nr:PEGA domain-containing protein [Vicinamibacterales bacterium]
MLHQIGSGVLGPVFRTYEPQVDRLVAVKAFKLDLVPEDVARLADALRRLAANPTTHPGIVRVLDAGLEGTSPFVAMEYASGESLDVALRDFTPGLGRALPLLIDIGRAIDAAWAEGRGHGALHPRDVIVSPGTADTRVTGFGIVQALESIGAKPPIRRPYTAPERAAGESWDIRADVYSLGAIAHEVLTGRRPLGSGEQDGTLAPDLTPEQRVNVRKVIGAALAERPENRYESATAFVAALEAIARGEGAVLPAAAHVAAPVQPERTVSRTVPLTPPTPRTWHPPPVDAPRSAPPPAQRAVTTVEPAKPAEPVTLPLPPLPAETQPPAEIDFPSERSSPPELPVPDEIPVRREPPAPDPPMPAGDVAPAPPSPSAEPRIPAVAIAPPPVSSTGPHPALGNAKISLAGSGNLQPIFSTRNTALDEPPAYPWRAIAAVAVACLLAGGVIGYALGIRRVATVVSQVRTAPPGSRTTTDVPITAEPPQKPPTAPAPPESRPSSPTASAQARESRPTPPPSAARVADVRGRLVVRSTPSGAIVRVDGRLHGETPITIRDLGLGAHTLQVARPGFVPRTDRVTLTRSQPSQTVAVQLEPGVDTANTSATKGSILVDSRPRGARVTIDGRAAGVTPVQIPEVMMGRHAVRLELTGYVPLSTEVLVTPGTPARLAVTLQLVR